MKQKHGMVTQILTEDEIMVVPTTGDMLNKVLTLNASSGFVWELLKEERSFEDLKEAVMNEYGISEQDAEKDLTELLKTIENYIE